VAPRKIRRLWQSEIAGKSQCRLRAIIGNALAGAVSRVTQRVGRIGAEGVIRRSATIQRTHAIAVYDWPHCSFHPDARGPIRNIGAAVANQTQISANRG
jgi:hypothetical protein